MTPNLRVLVEWTINNYGPKHIGIYKCRPIADSQTYSQHSWRNAGDIWGPIALLDEISVALDEQFGEHIRYKLWRRKNHWDHIHVDMWPRGLYTPPCAGGSLRVQHKDGRRGTVFTSDIEGGIMAFITVEQWQEILNAAGQLGADGKRLAEDDRFGPNTRHALVNGVAVLEGSGVAGPRGPEGLQGEIGLQGPIGPSGTLIVRGEKEI